MELEDFLKILSGGLRQIRDAMSRITTKLVPDMVLLTVGFVLYLFLFHRQLFLLVVARLGEYALIIILAAIALWFLKGIIKAQREAQSKKGGEESKSKGES